MDKWPQFVEAFVRGLAVDPLTNKAEVHLMDHQRQSFILMAAGVHSVFATEILLNNIIDRISIWDSSCPQQEYFDDLWMLLCGDMDGKGDPARQVRVQSALQDMKEGGLQLLKVEPVYGALVLILGSSYEVVPRQ